MTVLLVDVANVVGSRPDGWWRDRAGATTRLLGRLAGLAGREVAGPDGGTVRCTEVVAVVEGQGRAASAPDGVTVVRADGSGDDALADLAASPVGRGPAGGHRRPRPACAAARRHSGDRAGLVARTPRWVGGAQPNRGDGLPHAREQHRPPEVVLITGASSGIGRATALELAGRGAHLVLVARGEEALVATADQARAAGAGEVLVHPADVTDEDAIRKAVDSTVQQFGRLDAVVHSAQVMAYGTIEEVPREVFETVVETAVHGTAVVARVVLPVFREQGQGHLVVVNSLLGQVAAPLMGSYIAAKWGQLGLVRVLQQETRDVPGIDVSIVQPGGVDTPIYFQAASWAGSTGRPPPPVYSAQRLGRRIVSLLDRPRRQVQAGIFNPLITAAFRLAPGVYDFLVGPLLQRLAIADDDVPPTTGNVFASRPQGNATEGRWRSI